MNKSALSLDAVRRACVQDRRIETKDPSAFAVLTKRVKTGRREPVTELTADAARRLRTAHGEQVSSKWIGSGRRALYRCIPDAKGNLLEFWLAHPALAGTLPRARTE